MWFKDVVDKCMFILMDCIIAPAVIISVIVFVVCVSLAAYDHLFREHTPTVTLSTKDWECKSSVKIWQPPVYIGKVFYPGHYSDQCTQWNLK